MANQDLPPYSSYLLVVVLVPVRNLWESLFVEILGFPDLELLDTDIPNLHQVIHEGAQEIDDLSILVSLFFPREPIPA